MNIGTAILSGVEEVKKKSKISMGMYVIVIIIFATILLGAILQNKTFKIEVENGQVVRTGELTSLEDILNYAETAPKSQLANTWKYISATVKQGVQSTGIAIQSNNIFQAIMYIVYTIQGISSVIILIPALIIDILRYTVYIIGAILIL